MSARRAAAVGLALALLAGGWAMAAAGPTARANRATAVAQARMLLDALALPASAVPSAAEPTGAGPELARPSGAPATPNLVDRHRWWTVRGTPGSVIAYVQSHAPAGGRLTMTGSSGSGSQDVAYDWPPEPGVLGLRQLAVAAVQLRGGITAVRADGEAVWLAVRPAAERIPGGARRLVVDVTRFGSSLGRPFTVTRPVKLQRARALLNDLPLMQPGAVACPADWGVRVNLSFYGVSRWAPLAHAAIDPGGCGEVGLTLRGRSQPTLAGSSSPGVTIAVPITQQLERVLGVRLPLMPRSGPPFRRFHAGGVSLRIRRRGGCPPPWLARSTSARSGCPYAGSPLPRCWCPGLPAPPSAAAVSGSATRAAGSGRRR